MIAKYRMVVTVFLIAVLGWVVSAQIVIDPAAQADPEFRDAFRLFISTAEGRSIYASVWILSVLGGLWGRPGQPVLIRWVPNAELDPPPPQKKAYGMAVAAFDFQNQLTRPIEISIRSVRTGGRWNLADTIHHELRHAEIFLWYGSSNPAKNPRAALALAAHNRLDGDPANDIPPSDWANMRFRAELVIRSLRELLKRIRIPMIRWGWDYDWRHDLPFGGASSLANLVHETLFTVDGYGHLTPALAEQWEVSADGRELTVFLRPGLKFHDGRSFTASDVVYTYERFVIVDDREAPPWLRGMFIDHEGKLVLKSVKALNPLTVQFEFDRPLPPRFAEYHFPVLPNPWWGMAEIPILCRELGEKGDRNFPFVGLGPYTADLELFRGYWGAKPQVERIEFEWHPDPIRLPLALAYDGIDLFWMPQDPGFAWMIGQDFGLRMLKVRQVDGDGRGREYETWQPLLVVDPQLADALRDLLVTMDLGGDGYTARQGDWREED